MSSETKNILVVDDDNYIRIGLERGLSLEGYEVLVAENAAQATELLHENQIDLVLLDVNMPGRSGMELLPDIVAEYPDVAVIMLTGDGDLSAAVVAMREGAYDYAVKPWV